MALPEGFSTNTGFTPLNRLSKAEQEEMFRTLEREDYQLWAKVYPRLFEPRFKPDLYSSPKTVARRIMNIVHKVEAGFGGESEMHELLWASYMVESHMPVYWLAPDLMTAILQTKPPLELEWHDMKLPHEAMAFMLPRNVLSHKIEGNVEFISFARCRQLVAVQGLARQGTGDRISSENGCLMFLAQSEGGFLTHWNIPYDHYPKIDLRELDSMVHRYDEIRFDSGWINQVATTPEDTRIAAVVAHLIFGTLLLMLRKPELISPAQLIKRVSAKKGFPLKEFWTPGVIGENYKIRREIAHLGGTHASPIGHWVRGFWREMHYGPQRMMVKDQWIEPYWRGGDED